MASPNRQNLYSVNRNLAASRNPNINEEIRANSPQRIIENRMRQDIYNLLSEEFKAMDRNNDGSLEEDEFLGYLENMHLKYQ